MTQSISKDFRFLSLLRFAFPTMVMMVFTSLYTIIDGFFISRFVGSNALSSLNIVFPILSLMIGIGVMFASGGSALIAKKLGEKKEKEAFEDFSFIVLAAIILGFLIMGAGHLFLEPLSRLLGATDILLADCKTYLGIMLFFAPVSIIYLLFQTFFITAGSPNLGLTLTVIGGIVNMILDYVFIVPLHMGIAGAAFATGIGQSILAVAGLVFFFSNREGLHFVAPRFRFATLKKSCANGSSEMVTNLSTALVTYLYNMVMLRLAGESGVAAITIVLYGQFLFNALYFGFSMGVAPIISFNYGRKNHTLLRRIFKICVVFVSVSSLIATVIALVLSPVIVELFTPKGTDAYALAKTGFFLFSFSFIFAGMNIFASSMFTAFSNGIVSAGISFLRTFVCIVVSILLLPQIMGITGVWLAVPAAELVTCTVSVFFMIWGRKRYQY